MATVIDDCQIWLLFVARRRRQLPDLLAIHCSHLSLDVQIRHFRFAVDIFKCTNWSSTRLLDVVVDSPNWPFLALSSILSIVHVSPYNMPILVIFLSTESFIVSNGNIYRLVQPNCLRPPRSRVFTYGSELDLNAHIPPRSKFQPRPTVTKFSFVERKISVPRLLSPSDLLRTR